MECPQADWPWLTTIPTDGYMVVETFSDPRAVYERARERGRMLPAGLRYVDSWIDAQDLGRCFQLMVRKLVC